MITHHLMYLEILMNPFMPCHHSWRSLQKAERRRKNKDKEDKRKLKMKVCNSFDLMIG
jgi:diphthamide biosynthesis methyltransferase